MRRLVILARQLARGGAERQLVTLAQGLKARGHDVHVVLFYSGGTFDAELIATGVPVFFLGKGGRWDVIGFLIRLVTILRCLCPDVVYSFLDVPNILAALMRPIAGWPKLIWSIRAAGMEMRHYDWLTRSVPWLEERLSHRANMIIANSHAGAAWAAHRGFPADKLQIVENGIATEIFRPDEGARARVRAEWNVRNGERLIGLVARLDPMKDHPTFLHACAELSKSHADLRFVCIGDGRAAYRTELEALAAQLGIDRQIIWAGPRQDMPAVQNALDIACSASAFGEGFSNVIGEAMSCGVPCVVTDVGDSARIVGSLGEVILPRNAGAMVQALERMLARINMEPNLAKQLRLRIEEEFSLDKMVLRTERLLVDLR